MKKNVRRSRRRASRRPPVLLSEEDLRYLEGLLFDRYLPCSDDGRDEDVEIRTLNRVLYRQVVFT